MSEELKDTRVCYGENVMMMRVKDCIIFGNKDSLYDISMKIEEYLELKDWWAEQHLEENHIVHCKNCAHYEEDVIGYANKIPIIVAHHGCKVWGGPMGSKTDPDGWCYLGKKKENS